MGSGDYSTLASIPADAKGKAVLKIKEDGIIAGIGLAEEIFYFLEPGSTFTLFKKDGDKVALNYDDELITAMRVVPA